MRGRSRLNDNAGLQRRRLKLRVTHDEQKLSETSSECSPKTEVPSPIGRELVFRFQMWILKSNEKVKVWQSKWDSVSGYTMGPRYTVLRWTA
jgi:hypothetical protein